MNKNELISLLDYRTKRVSFCSANTEEQKIEIAGQVLIPNEETAYVEFYLSHGFPVQNKYRSAIHPAVVARSYQTLNHKVFNFCHLIKKYKPKQIPRDRILGTVVAVEFTGPTDGVWDLTSIENAPGIRAVAVMHKAAESVVEILTQWFTGEGEFGSDWSVSIENQFTIEKCGFLVRGHGNSMLAKFLETTPTDLKDLGWVYVSSQDAPALLMKCLNNDDDDIRESITSTRICRDFQGQEVVLLLGGLDNAIRYRGVGLTPAQFAQEEAAHVKHMMASETVVDLSNVFNPLKTLGEKFLEEI